MITVEYLLCLQYVGNVTVQTEDDSGTAFTVLTLEKCTL